MHRIEVASNRIRVGIACVAVAADVAWIHFEEQSGLLVANVATAGFVSALASTSLATFEIALAGLYKKAGVDVVREQVESLIGAGVPYDIADEGLVIWPGEGYESEVVYDLSASGALVGAARGAPLGAPPITLDAAQLQFRRQEIRWTSWVEAFAPGAAISRVITGPSLLR